MCDARARHPSPAPAIREQLAIYENGIQFAMLTILSQVSLIRVQFHYVFVIESVGRCVRFVRNVSLASLHLTHVLVVLD